MLSKRQKDAKVTGIEHTGRRTNLSHIPPRGSITETIRRSLRGIWDRGLVIVYECALSSWWPRTEGVHWRCSETTTRAQVRSRKGLLDMPEKS
jgi:hypothetical protein